MEKQVIYKSAFDSCYRMTNVSNYCAYVQDARKIKILHDVKTLQDVEDFINNACEWWNCTKKDFVVL